MDIIKNSDINFLSSDYTYASGKKDNSIYFTRDEVGSIIVNGKIYGQSNYTNISYNKLVNLRNTGALQTGVLYRITDYVTTTSQEGTKSAGIPFDIIVIATSNNTLSENAKAVHHDSNFNNEKVDSWEIKYCLDNDNTRFGWADITNGKGVIYYMKDEFNNEAWYDFKNIQFLRAASWFNENPNFPTQFTEDKYFYTFSVVNNGVITDDSLYSTKYHATDNHLGRNTAKITKLNNTIFIDTVNNGVFNNIIADGHGNNTFGQSVWNNNIGHNFTNNVIYTSFQYNNISSNFANNKVKDNFVYNEIGAGFTYNELNGKVMRTIFKPIFSGNKLNGSLTYCTFGSNNNYVTDFPSMTNVTIGNQCFNGTNNSKISLNNLFTSNGWNLLTTINGFNTEIEYTILSCSNNRYDIFSHSTFDKISNIYDLGSFETSGDAEEAAKNTNICSNANYSILKYYVPSLNKTGIIEQIVSQSSTRQIITWNGERKVRTLEFVNIDGNISLTNFTSWEELKILTATEWNNTTSNIVTTNTTQSISGEKTFTSNININEKDIIISGDTKICGNIDAGELKVFDNKTTKKGFTIRTLSEKTNDLYPIQILATNNSKSVQYTFPIKDIQGNNLPINSGINIITEKDITNESHDKAGIVYLKSYITNYNDLPNAYSKSALSLYGSYKMYTYIRGIIDENEEISSKSLVDLNERIESLTNLINQLQDQINKLTVNTTPEDVTYYGYQIIYDDVRIIESYGCTSVEDAELKAKEYIDEYSNAKREYGTYTICIFSYDKNHKITNVGDLEYAITTTTTSSTSTTSTTTIIPLTSTTTTRMTSTTSSTSTEMPSSTTTEMTSTTTDMVSTTTSTEMPSSTTTEMTSTTTDMVSTTTSTEMPSSTTTEMTSTTTSTEMPSSTTTEMTSTTTRMTSTTSSTSTEMPSTTTTGMTSTTTDMVSTTTSTEMPSSTTTEMTSTTTEMTTSTTSTEIPSTTIIPDVSVTTTNKP